MICARCLRRAPAFPSKYSIFRTFSSKGASFSPPSAPGAGHAEPFSNPLTPPNSAASNHKPKAVQIPASSCLPGTKLTGLNYLRGRDDPVALPDEEYPEWLWRCLEVKTKDGDDEADVGDEFAKSKKVRRKAAKQQRKIQAKMLASGDLSALQPKIPLTHQSIDLPGNDESTLEGALKAEEKRTELKAAMRTERRKKIKESNYLKSV